MALGDGHKPVNWPISPRSARFKATQHNSSVGRATVGMASNFLTKFCCEVVTGRLHQAATNFSKVESSGEKEGGVSDATPWSMTMNNKSIGHEKLEQCSKIIPARAVSHSQLEQPGKYPQQIPFQNHLQKNKKLQCNIYM